MDDNYKEIDLGIEVKDAKPSRPDFKWLGITVGTVVGFFAFSYLCFTLFANLVVANISIEKEKEIFGNFFNEELNSEVFNYKFTKEIPEFKNYNILVNDDIEINAYAFLGANIILTKGLLENIKYEEELQFIIAHEIGHIKTRDNLKSLARDLPFKITLFFIGFDVDLGITNFSDLTLNAFSRDTEKNSDNFSIELLKKYDINPYCASIFFDEESDIGLEFMSTHPSDKKRIENIKNNFIGERSFDNCVEINYGV